jgi:tetratricopeptide (TPR) repeat protein/transcriptional regulator with XRE-family HTH domain
VTAVREELAGRLRQLRDLTGRSLRELALDMHVSRSSLSRYFSGQAVPPWTTVVALCRAAGRDPRHLRELWERAQGAPQPPAPAASSSTRNDLPHDVTSFTGRRAELAVLLTAAGAGSLVAIDGMGGVGKSALAVHAAHLLTADFPGGRLYLNLHGFTPGRDRVEPAEALRVLLTALGVAPGRVPEEVTERAALWRSELASRRALVLLDNAADEDHVRDLLPGAGPSFVLITSRRRMVHLDGVQPVSLDVLPPAEAARLFTEAAGGTRPGDVGEVLRRCGNLPLTIRVVAARLRHRPAWTLDTLVERLRDGELAVPGVFEMSLRQLDAAQRTMFGLLGLVPGEDIDAYGAAALAGIPLADARAVLEDLIDVHLLQEPTAGRYRMHDLVRQAARADVGAADRVPAIARLGDYYLSCMVRVKELVGTLMPLPVSVSHPPPALPEFAGFDTAVDWADVEWANLTEMFALAVECGLDGPVVGLGQLVSLANLGPGTTASQYRRLAQSLPAAQRFGDRRMLASHHYLLGAALVRLGRVGEATAALHEARALMAADAVGEAFTLLQLAEIQVQLDDPEGAAGQLRQALALRPLTEAVRVRVSAALGRYLVLLGKNAEAGEVVAGVLDAARGLDRQTLRMCLDVLGWAALGEGDARSALDFAEQAHALNRSTRKPLFEAASHTDLAVALRHLDRTAEAAVAHAEAVRILERLGEDLALARSQMSYAQACLVMGDPAAAEPGFRAALEIYAAHGLSHLMPAAHAGLSRVSRPVPGHPGKI